MIKIGREEKSESYWKEATEKYVNNLDGDYHKHRLNVAFKLIPADLYQTAKQILDFGCGDAVMFPPFLEKGVKITGIDIMQEMIDLAKKRLKNGKHDENIVRIGDVNMLKDYPSQSLDAILSFNVLAYLTNEEEDLFYREAYRVLKVGGYLAVSHSNELFDLFSLNKYTVEFFEKNFMSKNNFQGKISQLLVNADKPETITAYNVRENPLAYKFKLNEYGFEEMQQEFSNLHVAPPTMLNDKQFPNTINWNESEKWKLMFTCSTYMSLSRKKTK